MLRITSPFHGAVLNGHHGVLANGKQQDERTLLPDPQGYAFLYFFRNLSTRPSVSMGFCLPV